MPGETTLVVFSNPVAGQEADYLNWYERQHLAEVVSIDGVAGGRFFAVEPAFDGAAMSPYPWQYFARYALTDPPPDVLARVYEANSSGRMGIPDWITDVGAWVLGPASADGAIDTGWLAAARAHAFAGATQPGGLGAVPAVADRLAPTGDAFDPSYPCPWTDIATWELAGADVPAPVDGQTVAAWRATPVCDAVLTN